MQPSQCQLALKTNPSMDQTMLCDEAFLLEMSQQLNSTTFQRNLFGVPGFALSTACGPITTSVTPAVAIPKSNSAFYYGVEDQFESLMSVNDSAFEGNLSLNLGQTQDYRVDFQCPLSPSLWSPGPDDFAKCDDILSASKADMNQDPTLAELNANEESLLDNLDNFDLPELLSEEKASDPVFTDYEETKVRWEKDKMTVQDVSSAQEQMSYVAVPAKAAIPFSTSVPTAFTTSTWSKQQKCDVDVKGDSKMKLDLPSRMDNRTSVNTLQELLSQYRTPKFEVPLLVNVTVPPTNVTLKSQLSSSVPTKPTIDQMWKMSAKSTPDSPKSVVEDVPKTVASTSAASTDEVFSGKEDFDSHDEGFDSDPEDTDHYEELTSDAESTVSEDMDNKQGHSTSSPSLKSSSKKERFFWQYNVQAKGPKINRLCMSPRSSDPHHLNEVTDPVFSSVCCMQGIKHSGKARRGDGNDLNPNPRKLFQIGQELRKLTKVINDLTPVSELPFSVRPKSRKEKNKLASRACRLKKKAQHEANKVKLYGLEQEHKKLINTLKETRKLFLSCVDEQEKGENGKKLTPQIEKLLKTNFKVMSYEYAFVENSLVPFFVKAEETKVAGNTAEYVNKILDKVSDGKASNHLENI